jgi:uncharacterized protein with HEPN domain
MKNKRDWVRIQHMIEAIERIERFLADSTLADFQDDELRQAAVIRQFEIIGEAASVIDSATTQAFPKLPWRQMKAFRNLLIHEYFRVDAAEVWAVYAQDLQGLKESLTLVLDWLSTE